MANRNLFQHTACFRIHNAQFIALLTDDIEPAPIGRNGKLSGPQPEWRARAAEWGGLDSLRLLHGDHTIDGRILKNLFAAAGPANRQLLNTSGWSKAKV